MSDIKINNITDRSGSSGPVFAGISTVSTSAFMVMPSAQQSIVVVEEEEYLQVVILQAAQNLVLQ